MKKLFKRFLILSLVQLLSLIWGGLSQINATQTGSTPDTLMGYKYFYLNPVRCFTDECSIFFEYQIKEEIAFGFSLGYKRKMEEIADNMETGIFPFYIEKPNFAIMYKSQGPVLRSYIKFLKEKRTNYIRYTAFHIQYKLLVCDHVDIDHDMEEYSVYETTTLSRTNHILGIQFHFGRRFMADKLLENSHFSIISELYFGFGINIHVYTTQYHDYINRAYSGNLIYSEIPRLENDRGVFPYPTLHMGFRMGIWYKR